MPDQSGISYRQVRVAAGVCLALVSAVLIARWLWHFNGAARALQGALGIGLLGLVPIVLPDDLHVNMFLLRVLGWLGIGISCALLWLFYQLMGI